MVRLLMLTLAGFFSIAGIVLWGIMKFAVAHPKIAIFGGVALWLMMAPANSLGFGQNEIEITAFLGACVLIWLAVRSKR